ncbi:MAG: SDR family oxidoreductase [Clostridia bacterium]|nr:SDR family oxidoreductase [Clostridia bacterium]NLS84674.1 SDR family oxidoreductase [Oscillospiraceae bacterium]
MNKNDAILITGANGFVGKNLVAQLKNEGYDNLLCFDIDTPKALLAEYAAKAKFVFHLAGVNRPKDPSEFYTGNRGFTEELLHLLVQNGNKAPVLMTSSIQAELDNDYGKSKREGEDLIFAHERETGAPALVFRMPNLFGKWCRPSYNSVVATFCHNIANDLPIEIRDPAYTVPLVYIDDVVKSFIDAMDGKAMRDCSIPGFCHLGCEVYDESLGHIAELINGFKNSREILSVPDMGDGFTSKLYSTYLSYIPEDKFSYPLDMHCDDRGSFTEFIRTNGQGQVSVNISKPHIVKGNHWHNSKNEKFLVVKGDGVIRFRKLNTDKVIEYKVSGDKLEVVDIPTGYTHNIENIGETDMVTVMWANEPFDPEKPDTYFLKV